MTAIIFIAAAVITVWGAWLLRRTGLLGGSIIVLFAGSVLSYPVFRASVAGIPVTVDRILALMLVAVFVVYWRLGRLERRRFDRQDIAVLALAVVLVVNAVTHGPTARTLASLGVFYIIPTCVYFILRATPLSDRALLGLLAVVAGFGFYLAATSVFEQQQITSLVFPRYIAASQYAEFLGRGRGPFLNPSGNGLYLVTGLVALLLLWPHVRHGGRAVIALATLVFLAGIACTLTRIVWGAALVALIVVAVGMLPRRWSVAFVLTFLAASAGVTALKWNDLTAFKHDKNVSVQDMRQSARLRPVLAFIAWQMFLDRPVMGCGFGHYGDESVYYLSDRSTSLPLEKTRGYVQHNIVLSLLTETGLVGAGTFMLVILFWLATGWRLYACRACALPARQIGMLAMVSLLVYFVIGMFQDLTIVPMANYLVFFLAGIGRSVAGARIQVAGERSTGALPVAPLVPEPITSPPRWSKT